MRTNTVLISISYVNYINIIHPEHHNSTVATQVLVVYTTNSVVMTELERVTIESYFYAYLSS